MKLSVITVCLNNLVGLRQTLDSLASQDTRAFESNVIDGNSTDGTREYLASYTPEWPLRFRCESDAGIYDAMNKGVRDARGEYVWFLNAGDTCAQNTTIATILTTLKSVPDIDLLYGKVWFKSEHGLRSVGKRVNSRAFHTMMPICHQGIIYRRETLLANPFSTEYTVISDWIVTRALFERGASSCFLNRHLAIYPLDGASSREQMTALREKLNYEKTWRGKARVLLLHGTHAFALWFAKQTGFYDWYKKRRLIPHNRESSV